MSLTAFNRVIYQYTFLGYLVHFMKYQGYISLWINNNSILYLSLLGKKVFLWSYNLLLDFCSIFAVALQQLTKNRVQKFQKKISKKFSRNFLQYYMHSHVITYYCVTHCKKVNILRAKTILNLSGQDWIAKNAIGNIKFITLKFHCHQMNFTEHLC